MSVTQLKDGRWIVQYPRQDKEKKGPRLIREYFGRGPSARLKAEQRDTDLALKQTRPKTIENTGPLFYEIAAEYQRDRKRDESAGRTEAHLSNMLQNTIFPRLGQYQAIRITHDIISDYVTARLKTVKRSTVHRELTVIKAALNWATKKRPPLIPYNPVRDFYLPEGDSPLIIPPSRHEIDAILKHAKPRLVRAIKIAFYTGLRPGPVELFSLQWSSVIWDKDLIRIVSARKGGAVLRDIPIHPDLKPLLEQWWRDDGQSMGNIFHCYGKPVSDMRAAWEHAKKKAGITRPIRMYDMRHDFVTTAIESGVDIKTLSEIVGSNPETLRRHYQHVSGSSRVKAIQTIRPQTAGNTSGNNP